MIEEIPMTPEETDSLYSDLCHSSPNDPPRRGCLIHSFCMRQDGRVMTDHQWLTATEEEVRWLAEIMNQNREYFYRYLYWMDQLFDTRNFLQTKIRKAEAQR